MLEIVDHTAALAPRVIELILAIQRDEFGFGISAADQPDLLDVATFYRHGAGGFWVALHAGEVVGTIALRDIGEQQGALRKMFVQAGYRGREHGVAPALLQHLLRAASAGGLREIYLGTTEKFLAAHRFYEKHGFAQVAIAELPAAFPRMSVDTRFYRRRLD
jgi:N-acetylglutamate synthase-like GNAT family acetyltransferase